MDEIQKLKQKITVLETKIKELTNDLIHDSLTSLKTRRYFEEELSTFLYQIKSAKESLTKRKDWALFNNLSILFFDVDHFKKINDTYGHDVGDRVLKEVSKVISSTIRSGDTIARWGGEEMVASLLGADENDAKEKAELVRVNVSKMSFSDLPDLKVTISIGVASFFDGATKDSLIKNADSALYKAKESGRNKVVVYSEIKE